MKRVLRHGLVMFAFGAALAVQSPGSWAQAATPADEPPHKLYAVEFRVGPRWDAEKQAHEQEHFSEHVANLQMLREQGSLVLGARYGEVGLVILAAESEDAARAMVEQDPTVQHGIFRYDLNEFSVFYGGAVEPPPRKP